MVRIVVVFLLLCASAAQAQDVVVYRCEDAKGRLTLRDSPCNAGEKQQTRNMTRPRDPAPASASANAPPVVPATAPPVRETVVERVILRVPARPMYECIDPDGQRYTSDSGEGTLRWVPYGGLGYAVVPHPLPPRPPVPPTPGERPPPRPGGFIAVPVGAWQRDACQMLPQADTCARLSDRRYEILRRYGSAMPSERRALDQEQRGIDARIANDCGNP